MNFIDHINTNNYAYIGPIFFVFIFLLMFLIGYINGLKTSLYFAAMNIFGYAIALLVAIFTFKKVIHLIPGKISIAGKTINFSSVINSTQDTIKAFVITIITLTTYFIFLFISFIIYWFLRKRLKHNMWEARNENKPLLTNRLLGGTVSLLYMMPFITSGTSILSLISKENAFTNLNGFLNQAFSFNQVKDLRGRTVSIYQTVQNVKEVLGVGHSIEAIFGAATKGDGEKALSEIMGNQHTKDALKFLLTNDAVLNHLNIIKAISPDAISGFDLSIDTKILYKAPDNSALEISKMQFDKLQHTISNLINGWNKSSATPEGVAKFFLDSGLLKVKG